MLQTRFENEQFNSLPEITSTSRSHLGFISTDRPDSSQVSLVARRSFLRSSRAFLCLACRSACLSSPEEHLEKRSTPRPERSDGRGDLRWIRSVNTAGVLLAGLFFLGV